MFIFFFLQSFATWESENKIHCKQTLVEGDGPKTWWTRELNGDQLTLVSIKASKQKIALGSGDWEGGSEAALGCTGLFPTSSVLCLRNS